ncbi:MAG: hypothetical protein LC659_01585, partial [Myxococcales bacterium]|nr:hypothetical protein [Myxococcales bacterium]
VPWKQDFTHTEGLFRLGFDITELAPGHRRIRGSVSGGPSTIDLDVSPDQLVGQIGASHFTLAADGGYLLGRYRREGDIGPRVDEPYAIWGREALATMVPADEALLIVMMLTCDGIIVLDGNRVRGFTLVKLSS